MSGTSIAYSSLPPYTDPYAPMPLLRHVRYQHSLGCAIPIASSLHRPLCSYAMSSTGIATSLRCIWLKSLGRCYAVCLVLRREKKVQETAFVVLIVPRRWVLAFDSGVCGAFQGTTADG
eukprot:3617249-Rhodomonas_salina.1